MNQEASEPLPCPVPSPGSVGMLARCDTSWARSAYGGGWRWRTVSAGMKERGRLSYCTRNIWGDAWGLWF